MDTASAPSIRLRGALTLMALLALLLAVTAPLDRLGSEYAESGFKRAMLTFAAARGLNAVISVAQGTEVAIEPAGVGVNFTPGEILDPVNDLVERFSWVMLASATALGIQRLALEAVATPAFTTLIGLVLLVAVGVMWRSSRTPWLSRLALRMSLFLLLLRFCIPLIALAGEGFYHAFLAERYDLATRRIEAVTDELRGIDDATRREALAADEGGLMERARRAYATALTQLDVSRHLARYEAAAAEISEQVVGLIITFLVQTVLLPLGLLWLLVKLLALIWRLPLKT